MPLKVKLTLGAVALVVVSLIGLVSGNLLLAQRLSDRQERAQAELALELVSGALADAVIVYDLATIDDVLRAIVAEPSVRLAAVWAADGTLLSRQAADAGAPSETGTAPSSDEGRHFVSSRNTLLAEQPLNAAGMKIGTVRIEMDRDWISTSLRNSRMFNLLFSAGIATVMAVAAYIMAARLGRQVALLRDGAARVAAGDTGFRIPARGNDEISEATRSFNAMSAALEAERRKLDAQLRSDHLTGASNRLGLQEFLHRETAAGRGVHLLHVDLDHFKQVNDVHGHPAGDAILKNVVFRLDVLAIPVGGLVARAGGDEFVLALPESSDGQEPSRIASDAIRDLRRPVPWEGRSLFVGASVGMSRVPPGATDKQIEDAIVAADIALYASKAGGRGRLTVFDSTMRTRVTDKAKIEEEIREGLARGEFVPYLQPQVSVADLAPVGFEVLVRWQHPRRGLLSPGEFIDVIGDGDLLHDIDWTVRANALDWLVQALETWPQARGIKLGLNLTERQLQTTDTADRLLDLIWCGGVPFENIAIEILESVVLDAEIGATRANLMAFHKAGCVLELDDFGTGNAALRTLVTVPVGRIKLDKSLVQGIAASPEQRHILKALTGMASSLDVETLAEGVETEADLRQLGSLGIDAVQGFLCGQAMSMEDASVWLSQRLGDGSQRLEALPAE
ncbi:diguanylate cyclase/phosphodiesterase (GGDEF & EAL domains) with PAS/PAC sensor(s) [Rhodovulum sp. P5]|uniref:putative bifunctional diguanylate cyclase/phosphodiesterase n=1 Tax=Rhodovulum sp. P5 TaxID=1564506 RepID=UPI0009C34568|nr:GGDEF and EAL domain-containing protein [Rhodovulum sp. P5]ARE38626.1 diguanylate cyclase/phosphodiesterase (GGDEF & EAL domains) with PAS/PAC sensor(s) [Rhodovulum sp. P5]